MLRYEGITWISGPLPSLKKTNAWSRIATELAKRRSEKPSPGTIYPALKGLKDSGFLGEMKGVKPSPIVLHLEVKRHSS